MAGDGFIYTLTFAPDRNAVTYQLEFHSGFLYNASRGAVRMSPERTYTYAMLDTTCSGFGYVPDMSDTGRCTCFTGYTGVRFCVLLYLFLFLSFFFFIFLL